MAKAKAAIKPFCRSQNQSYVEWNDILPESSPGTALQGARYKEDVTQKQLAEKTGLSVKHISALENNKEKLNIEDAKKIAHVLKVNYKIFLVE